jgi:hypothetical protein
MKHIKKKFLLQKQLEKEEKVQLDNSLEYRDFKDISIDELIQISQENLIFSRTDKDFIFPLLLQKIDNEKFFIPMPDPTLIYFNSAQNAYSALKDAKTRLKAKLDFKMLQEETAINEIYFYFGLSSQFVIFLFTAIESFVNQMIPNEYVYKRELKTKTEIFNSDQIQRFISFDDKLKEVLPDCTGINFFKTQTATNQHIVNLKKFRDEIVHTKKDIKNSNLFYDSLISKSFSFKYVDTILAVQKFMNHYKKDYIVECGCDEDH